jgi:hypothetical protein
MRTERNIARWRYTQGRRINNLVGEVATPTSGVNLPAETCLPMTPHLVEKRGSTRSSRSHPILTALRAMFALGISFLLVPYRSFKLRVGLFLKHERTRSQFLGY